MPFVYARLDPTFVFPRFALFVCIAAALGAIVYKLCADPNSRRPQFRGPWASPRAGRWLGGAVAAAVIAAAWLAHFGEPFLVEVRADSVVFVRAMPTREVVIPFDRMAGCSIGRRGLVVEDIDGARYASGGLGRQWEALAEALAEARGAGC